MKKFLLLLLTLQYSLHFTALAQQPGSLDNSFGTAGQVTLQFAPWKDMAIQPDGRILTVSNIVARYKQNGALDNTFGINGIDTIKVNSSAYTCNVIALQPDGKILVAGGSLFSNTDLKDFLLIRYNTDGSLDSSFDGDGFLMTDFNLGSADYAYELAVQSDGKIIVAGASNSKIALSRYHPDGMLDSAFDYDGKLIINNISANFAVDWNHATYMKLQPDGKILVGSGYFMTRLNPDGSLDNGFGFNGQVGFPEFMNDLTVQQDGKIVLAGGEPDFAVVRLNTNGRMDSSFGTGGVTTTHWQNSGCSNPRQMATSVTLQPDGRILAAGYDKCCILGDCRSFVLIRYNKNGSVDTSFGSNGRVSTTFPLIFSFESHASAITPDLKIVLAGYSDYMDIVGGLAQYYLGPMLDVNNIGGPIGQFVISPNPAFDWINIEASGIENGIWQLQIRDLTGRSVLQEELRTINGSIQRKLSLNDLPAGLYLLQLDNGKNKTVSRVIKYK